MWRDGRRKGTEFGGVVCQNLISLMFSASNNFNGFIMSSEKMKVALCAVNTAALDMDSVDQTDKHFLARASFEKQM